MFDIGGWEFLLIAILGIIIIGPKELPGAIRTVSIFVRRARELARDFQSGLEDVAREAELDKLGEDLVGTSDPNSAIGGFRKELEDAVDPDGHIRESMDYDADWRDDEMIDYDDPEFSDENPMLDPELKEAAEDGAATSEDTAYQADNADANTDDQSTPDSDADKDQPASDKKPDVPS
jgi:sec-independent protein translocase protein TatB